MEPSYAAPFSYIHKPQALTPPPSDSISIKSKFSVFHQSPLSSTDQLAPIIVVPPLPEDASSYIYNFDEFIPLEILEAMKAGSGRTIFKVLFRNNLILEMSAHQLTNYPALMEEYFEKFRDGTSIHGRVRKQAKLL
ncbi:hypothetical protein NEOLI_003167 [Neolecta irregularis DAH-3]|uniref:Uncharacterized protein n=1 Tax=Neolecta irregularis (strain DAH-3) TaxID=1198029 RepID=A0A1U7LPR3_NEOID|nr:hypothetical protein NEOLI_003167 [Neolecta irregularis DAH-3]|eukprot:OLL24634.1 hypothetical protein NEOLI_003167 [Neolecta irregularis DAH-3]